METLPVPMITPVGSVFTGVYTAVASATGSSTLAMIFTVIMIIAIVFLLWQVGKWVYKLFTDDPEEEMIQYYDATGKPVAVVTR